MTDRSPTITRNRVAILLFAALLAALPLLGTRPARAAATFTVNLTGDAADLNPTDNTCDASAGAGLQCTLRAAIQQANATPGRDTIAFNIPGTGVKTIRPATELPPITKPTTIDGYTQPGATPNTLPTGGMNAVLRIELDGSNVGFENGLRIDAPNTVVKGLVINRFGDDGILLASAAVGARIEGCFIGTNAAGTGDRGNTGGVKASPGAVDVVVGGTTPAARNLISGNNGPGVFFLESASRNSRIEGNLIGTDKSGAGSLGNGSGAIVAGRDNTVGGNSAAAANTIAFNAGDGVEIVGFQKTEGNRVLRNSIFANGKDGIDLVNIDGPDPNDPGDADDGPNNMQNKPILTAATTAGGTTTITGSLNSAPSATFVLRFFSNGAGDEGKVFRGQLNVVTGADGNGAFTFTAASAIPPGHTVTATATSTGGDTSEFSVPVVAQ